MEQSNLKYNLRPLWDANLEVFKVFADICKKYGLRYCADTGTTLGAVRHKGFIPWDDDFDVQMPRPDYERFVDIASGALPPGVAWLDRSNCPTYEQSFGKVIVTDRDKVLRVSEATGLRLGQGIFIDVFPVDGFPDSKLKRAWRSLENRWWELFALFCKIVREAHLVRDPDKQRIRVHRLIARYYEKRAKRYRFGATKLCVSIGLSRAFDDKPYHYKYFGSPREIPFDNTCIYVQENVEGYLTDLFGDYMRLPPPEKRHPGHGLGADMPWKFGPDVIENGSERR